MRPEEWEDTHSPRRVGREILRSAGIALVFGAAWAGIWFFCEKRGMRFAADILTGVLAFAYLLVVSKAESLRSAGYKGLYVLELGLGTGVLLMAGYQCAMRILTGNLD